MTFKWEQRDANAPTPRADFIIAWIKDLVSLHAKQTRECLRDKYGFCCLGIASNTAGYEWTWDAQINKYSIKSNTDSLPNGLAEFLKTDGNCVTVLEGEVVKIKNAIYLGLVSMNDGGESFRTIAKTIQINCEKLFKDMIPNEINYIKEYKIPTRSELRRIAKTGEVNV